MPRKAQRVRRAPPDGSGTASRRTSSRASSSKVRTGPDSGSVVQASSSKARTGPARPSEPSGTRDQPDESGSVVRASSSKARTGPARLSKRPGTPNHSAETGSVVRARSRDARTGPARLSERPGTPNHSAETGSVVRARSRDARTGPARLSEPSGTRDQPDETGSVVRASSRDARTGPARPSERPGTATHSAETGSVVRASSRDARTGPARLSKRPGTPQPLRRDRLRCAGEFPRRNGADALVRDRPMGRAAWPGGRDQGVARGSGDPPHTKSPHSAASARLAGGAPASGQRTVRNPVQASRRGPRAARPGRPAAFRRGHPPGPSPRRPSGDGGRRRARAARARGIDGARAPVEPRVEPAARRPSGPQEGALESGGGATRFLRRSDPLLLYSVDRSAARHRSRRLRGCFGRACASRVGSLRHAAYGFGSRRAKPDCND